MSPIFLDRKICLFPNSTSSNERKYVIFGMDDGVVRVCRVNPEDDADFSDHWTLPMHDNMNGCVPSMRLGCDRKTLLTCGYDGNVFSYAINDDSPEVQVPAPAVTPVMVCFFFYFSNNSHR